MSAAGRERLAPAVTRALRRFGVVAVVALAAAACTVTFEPFEPTAAQRERPAAATQTNLVRQFVPTRGEGSTYRVGDPIAFQVRTTEDGYVTLTAIDPDGSVYVFARNVPVRGGRTEVIAGLSPRQRFVITPPIGWHRVTAHFTPVRTDERVQFVGVVGYDAWQSSIRVELQPFPRVDVVETRFQVRR